MFGGVGGVHLRIHLLLDNSQEDLSPTLESCEVCGSAHTPPGNWKEGGDKGRGEEGQVKEGEMEVRGEEKRGGGWLKQVKKWRRREKGGMGEKSNEGEEDKKRAT